MKKSLYGILLGVMLTFLTGCGGGDSSSTNESTATLGETYAAWTVAKNNLVRDVSKDIGANTIKVLIEPDKQIGEDDISNTVDLVYGKINGTDTKLRINQNYKTGTKMIVCIYDPSGNMLTTSEELTYAGIDSNVKFNDISF